MDEIIISDECLRKIENHGPRKVTGYFSSLKTGKSIPWESQLEKDNLIITEFDRYVIDYRAQCVKIMFTMMGKIHVHYPDVFEVLKTKKRIVEVKPKERIEKYRDKFSIIESVCKKNGYEYMVKTEDQIRIEPNLSNMKLLFKYARKFISQNDFAKITDIFSAVEYKSIADAELKLSPYGLNSGDIYWSIYHGYLRADLNQPLNSGSIIHLSRGNHKGGNSINQN